LKKILLIVTALLIKQVLFCQQVSYWQQETNYIIDVRLNDIDHSLDGFLKLEYINHSPDTISFIWFHLWPNAFKNDRTAFSEQLLQNGRTDFYFSDKEERGYINRLDFRTDNNILKTEDHPLYIDIVKVFLSQPLLPFGRVEISTPFHVKLPKNFSRGGHTGNAYQVTQWYPKPAVYDRKGWHPMPYLDQGEFYSEFGNFDVRITVPASYVVAATGELQNSEQVGFATAVTGNEAISVGGEKPDINTSKKQNEKAKTSSRKSTVKRSTRTNPSTTKKSPATIQPLKVSELKTYQFKQNNIHDFAWFADKKYLVMKDSVQLASGRIVKVYAYHTSVESKAWYNSTRLIKDAILFRSATIGEYPYGSVSVVEAKMGFDGGMEYPTITSISPVQSEKDLEDLIEHEVGHNWFYSVLASNEREHPWMDEGMNSYYDMRYQEWKYAGRKDETKDALSGKIPDHPEELLLNAYIKQKLDQPISTSADEFTVINNSLIAYTKTALWMKQLEKQLGRQLFDSCMRQYYREWQFKHPYPEDFQQLVQRIAATDVSEHFQALEEKGKTFGKSRKLKPMFLFSLNNTEKFNYLNVLPAAGYNKYDGFMIGAVLHNFNLPSNAFQFVAIPMYATGSKRLNGIGNVSFTYLPDKTIRKIRLAVSGATFSTLKGIDSTNNNIFAGFRKIVPALRITFKNKLARSTIEKWLEWKTFIISENGFNYNRKSTDSLFYPAEGLFKSRYLNQLVFNVTDYRVLYPYDVQLQIQQGNGFYRANAIANYFFNYAKGGGMQLRFFGAGFGYLGGKTDAKQFETSVYHPKLTAVRGNEDYTYSNYFIGRNESEYFLSQQIMLRDGGLKLRTDLFQGLQGRSDKWVTSLNLNSTLPKIDFPIKLPVKIFFDIGTYAEAWEKEAATSRFLYVGGLQLSLFKSLLNIYAPLVYSREFRDNLKTVPGENKFFQRLSFSIDIHRFDLQRIIGNKIPL
jgi:hypothetical protein